MGSCMGLRLRGPTALKLECVVSDSVSPRAPSGMGAGPENPGPFGTEPAERGQHPAARTGARSGREGSPPAIRSDDLATTLGSINGQNPSRNS